MRIFYIILLLACTYTAEAQETSAGDNLLSIKTTPTAFIDIYGGYSYRLGLEAKLHHNIAAAIEYGRYYNIGNTGIKIDPKGFIVKPEWRVYLNNKQQTTGSYISLEYMYKKIVYDYKDSIRMPLTPVFQKQYTIHKNVQALAIKYGELKVYRNRFIFEWYAGAGIRWINGYNSLSEQENDGLLTGENHGDMIGDGQRAIDGLYPHISLGFKIGYSIK
jgi:hypothetical protein